MTAAEQANTSSTLTTFLTMTWLTLLHFTNNFIQNLIKVSIIVIHFHWLSTNEWNNAIQTAFAAYLYTVPEGGGTFNIGKSWKSQEIPGHFPRPNVNKLHVVSPSSTRQRWQRSFSMVSRQALFNDVNDVHSYRGPQRRRDTYSSTPILYTVSLHNLTISN